MAFSDSAAGCLVGCAMGDSLGLPFEAINRSRVNKLLGSGELSHRFFFGHGMVSDDTEHSLIVASCLIRFPDDPEAFQRALAKELKRWLLGFPAGIGLATLKSILRLMIGVQPHKCGVFSAGNGPAMRSAIIGCAHCEDHELRRVFTERSAQLTHSDPKATYGAMAISEIAACLARGDWRELPEPAEIEALLRNITDDEEWQDLTGLTIECLREGFPLDEFPDRLGCPNGVSGYTYHTVPFAIACWFRHFGDFRMTTETCIRGGGDSDTTAAITAALAGITCYPDGIPADWKQKLLLWPIKKESLSDFSIARKQPPLALVWARNSLFFATILVHCLRRCLPPY